MAGRMPTPHFHLNEALGCGAQCVFATCPAGGANRVGWALVLEFAVNLAGSVLLPANPWV